MSWLKRHFLLAIGGLVAVGLIGVGTWYLLGSVSKNKEVAEQLEAQKIALEGFYKKEPFASRTNVDAAKREIAKVRTAITQARQSFTTVPYENVKDMAFKTLLDNTIDAMHKRAEKASVEVPNKNYAFSFEAQKKALKFSASSFPGIVIQLAEVKTICDILFEAKINRLISIRRARLSGDDPQGGADYVDFPVATNDITGAVISPYQAEFNCFSSELAAAMEGLYKSSHGLLVKALMVDPTERSAAPPPPPVVVPPPIPQGTNRPNIRFPPGPRTPPVAATTLTNVLNERLLKVILRIEVVKPPAGKT